MRAINVIFPMAGDGVRFGGTFKPFLDATEKKFIELAKEPFEVLKSLYDDVRYIFVYRSDQEMDFNIKEKLQKFFPNDSLTFCILPAKTRGPVDTIQQAVHKLSLSGEAFTCDCDHSININPMVSVLKESTASAPDILIPVWKCKDYEAKDFSKVKIDLSGEILSFTEKELIPPSPNYIVMGVIGCYYWKQIEVITGFEGHENFSEFMIQFKEKKIIPVEINEAKFFGTPEKLQEFRFQQAKQMTFFVDIDGTLIVQSKSILYDPEDVTVLPGTREKLAQWKNEGHRIILTTGRESPRKARLERMLQALKIPYDDILTGCNSGTRVLINDKKPYCPIHKMAMAFQLKRNLGIADIQIEETPEILKILKGASFATVYLIRKNDKVVVRKYIEKTHDNKIHVDYLKHQLHELRRFAFMSPGSVPAILDEYESQNEYFFDIEYLENYIQLSNVDPDTLQHVLPCVLRKLKTDIYSFKKSVNGQEWMSAYLKEKVLPRLDQIQAYGPIFASLINDRCIKINDVETKGLRYFFEANKVFEFSPTEISPVHGDLTLENIMYNISTRDFKFIDQAGLRYFDPFQIDLGKIFQSVISRYECWDFYESIYAENNGEFFIPQGFMEFAIDDVEFILKEFTSSDLEPLFKQSVFFLSTHLIRLVPFMIKKSTDKSIFALLLALVYLYRIM
jgi:hydroxymethylpyrimidine pyrophosphatase-like HAD family hydrolase